MYTKEITIYEYAELSEAAKERARQWYCESLDFDWWDAVYDDAKTIAGLLGIEIDDILFSGFWSQGDGACFTGRYAYAKGGLMAVKDYAPLDEELHAIAQGLQVVQKRHFYKLEASVKHRGHYSHEYCTDINIHHTDDEYRDIGEDEEILSELLRDFMRWIYRQLENEYEGLTSEEAIAESMEANGYTFDEYGNRED